MWSIKGFFGHVLLFLSLSFTHSHTISLSLSRPIIIMKWPLSGMCVRAHSVVYMIAIIESANAAVLGQRSNFTFSPAKHNTKNRRRRVHKHGKTGPSAVAIWLQGFDRRKKNWLIKDHTQIKLVFLADYHYKRSPSTFIWGFSWSGSETLLI